MHERTEDWEPLRGYVYDANGYHSGPIELDLPGVFERFLDRIAQPAIDEGREVRITDRWDFMVFHSKDGKILWPTPERNGRAERNGCSKGGGR